MSQIHKWIQQVLKQHSWGRKWDRVKTHPKLYNRATPKSVYWFSSTTLPKEKESQKLKPVRVMVKADSTTAKVAGS